MTNQQLVRELFDLHPSVSARSLTVCVKENMFDDFSCALQKAIAIHGRLYITDSFLCFSSSMLSLE